jgi:photosystem II stability/assembly factor-like uncharacterized protein
VRLLAAIFAISALLKAEDSKIDKVCAPEDTDAFGLTCSEDDPCPVFLELAAAEASGNTVFLTGNLHTVNTTMFSLLLKSEDGGSTWTEPSKRLRSSALEQIQFSDFQHGWIGGVNLDPLPHDPFVLITSDGGKTWRQNPLFEESRYGSIQQFWFESATAGQLIFDRSQGQTKRYELYDTMTGGTSWELKEVSGQAMTLAKAKPKDNAVWRVRVEKQNYLVERRTNAGWETASTFPVRAGECR